MREQKQSVGQLIRAIRRLRAPSVRLLRDSPLRKPEHVLAQAEREPKTVVSRDTIRQMDWSHRRGARGAMLVTEAIDCVPIAEAVTGRQQPGGSLLLEVQGQSDLDIAERQAAKLARTMDKAKGASQRTSYATIC